MTASSSVPFAPIDASARPGCGPCGIPSGWMRDRPVLDPLPAHELARRVEEHLVGIDVAVVVRRRDRLRMEVERPRAERADHESVALERLVHRRRLVHAADDRLEVVDVERPRIEHPVPPDDVARVVVEHELVEAVVLLHDDPEIAPLVVRHELARHLEVALAVRRALDDLAVVVAVALDGVRTYPRLSMIRSFAGLREQIAVQNAAMDDQVVARRDRQVAELRLERALPFRDVHDFIALRVAVEVLVLLVGLRVQHRDVVVEQDRRAVERRASAAREPRGAKVAVPQRPVGIGLVLHVANSPRRTSRSSADTRDRAATTAP